MKIIADENIPCVKEAFASLGEVTLLPGRSMQPEQLRDADILLVRSVTAVDQALLEYSSVRFVGSATIGFDHVDRAYLQQQGIGFATAPGCNATSAAEYVVSALLVLAERKDFALAGKTVGIIGCGNVGSRVRKKLAALGMRCVVNDPPLQAQGGHDDFVSLDEVLQADVITVHVPYTREGDYPTHHLFDEVLLRQLPPGALFINTSRGAVTDNRALDALLAERDDLSVVLDVWEGEPAINTSLLQRVDLGTPHIAGYSLDGKLRGTEMIYRSASDWFGHSGCWSAADYLPAGSVVEHSESGVTTMLRAAVFSVYDVRADDARLRAMLDLPPGEQSAYFDRLRKEYPVRREFSATSVLVDDADSECESILRGLGFPVVVSA
ncbi:MAG TPA: 4-phosphoerythronate dehydrogenase PdxB [Gammaproteobacteria bacterium]|nr:4-phosphoerythronate dehydrogenase PdxB [Gammaproteobacteria bacterium]